MQVFDGPLLEFTAAERELSRSPAGSTQGDPLSRVLPLRSKALTRNASVTLVEGEEGKGDYEKKAKIKKAKAKTLRGAPPQTNPKSKESLGRSVKLGTTRGPLI